MEVIFIREETELGDCEVRDSFSDSWTDESESEKMWRLDGSSSEDGASEPDNPWPLNDRLGHLYFQYFEKSPPYVRVPLMDKVISSISFSSVYAILFCFIRIQTRKRCKDLLESHPDGHLEKKNLYFLTA